MSRSYRTSRERILDQAEELIGVAESLLVIAALPVGRFEVAEILVRHCDTSPRDDIIERFESILELYSSKHAYSRSHNKGLDRLQGRVKSEGEGGVGMQLIRKWPGRGENYKTIAKDSRQGQ